MWFLFYTNEIERNDGSIPACLEVLVILTDWFMHAVIVEIGLVVIEVLERYSEASAVVDSNA